MSRPKKPNYAEVEVGGKKVVEVTLKVLVPLEKITAVETETKATRTGAVQTIREKLTAEVQATL